jgi:hypothetical protein
MPYPRQTMSGSNADSKLGQKPAGLELSLEEDEFDF